MSFDLKRLGLGQQIAAAGAIALFIFFIALDWFTVHGGGASAGLSPWNSFRLVSLLILLTIVVTIGWAALTATDTKLSLPVAPSLIVAGLAGLTTLIVAYRMLIDNPGHITVGGVSGNVPDSAIDVDFGAWLGLLSLIAITVGAFLAMQEEGVSVPGTSAAPAAAPAPAPAEPPAPPAEAPPEAPAGEAPTA
jgi:hypothetical protein